MPRTDLHAVLADLDAVRRPGRFRFEMADGVTDRSAVQVMVTEPEGTTVVVAADDGPWAWLMLSVETDLELIGLTAALAPALAHRGIPTNIVTGLRHDHLFVPHEAAADALACIRNVAESGGALPLSDGGPPSLPVAELTSAAAVLSRLPHPTFAAVLGALHAAGDDGCTDRDLVESIDADPKVTLGICAALIDAQLVDVVDGSNRLTTTRPPGLAAALRELASGPLRVPGNLAGYVENGRIARYPKRAADLDALLACVVDAVGPGAVYNERSLSQRLAAMGDPAELRRNLVDRDFAERTATGSRYFVRTSPLTPER